MLVPHQVLYETSACYNQRCLAVSRSIRPGEREGGDAIEGHQGHDSLVVGGVPQPRSPAADDLRPGDVHGMHGMQKIFFVNVFWSK